jgi:ankyrin repeat protein
LLVENNADVECKNEAGDTGLILDSHTECVEVLIEARAEVNHHEEVDGWTGGLLACEMGNVECLRLLIENNADVDWKTENGDTGLMVAARNGHPEYVKVLIEAKADVDYEDQNGGTALTVAIAKKHFDYLMLLLDHSDGGTPASADTKAHALALYWSARRRNSLHLRPSC